MNAVAHLLPDSAWHKPAVLAMIGRAAGLLLDTGKISMQGTAPNGQHFVANPRLIWAVVDSHAQLEGENFGAPGPVHPQARLGDFWIPQRGILAVGQAYFDAFDPARHSAKTSR